MPRFLDRPIYYNGSGGLTYPNKLTMKILRGTGNGKDYLGYTIVYFPQIETSYSITTLLTNLGCTSVNNAWPFVNGAVFYNNNAAVIVGLYYSQSLLQAIITGCNNGSTAISDFTQYGLNSNWYTEQTVNLDLDSYY